MRKFLLGAVGVGIALLVLSGCSFMPKPNDDSPYRLSQTNLDKVDIALYEGERAAESYIQYGDGSIEDISEESIGLFINGSIIKNAKVLLVDEQFFAPLSKLSGPLEFQTLWERDIEQAIITGNGMRAVITAGNPVIQSGKQNIQLESAPAIINNQLYMPVSFVETLLQGSVSYFDGTDSRLAHIVDRMPHIMISYYPKQFDYLSKDNAVEIAKSLLIKAYEKKFGAFSSPTEDKKTDSSDEKENLRYLIANMAVQAENDRYYVMHLMYDVWVDKYTGDVYTYYNGISMGIRKFDADDENVLAFPG
ncbi:hypothetical protein A7K91_11310 [Paenibacillus oryzae]|uniref:Copper amine oxidase-like N-terminal domain-containing protein n=1 Tax=Paenibacillus oryzae TaxID=1844972 RepID=A0A1A5YEB0_9BACL|nr:stalk domain-containing protein [Paenibacillus oryzae]OBR63976.1 hypothetical protein A7K91_11310 [Paenibacillus oryzae]